MDPTSEHPPPPRRILCDSILFFSFVAIGSLLTYRAVSDLSIFLKTREWIRTPCNITHLDLQREERVADTDMPMSITLYRCVVNYTYDANAMRYDGFRAGPLAVYGDKSMCESLTGINRTSCYYNPRNVEESVLNIDYFSPMRATLCAVGAFALVHFAIYGMANGFWLVEATMRQPVPWGVAFFASIHAAASCVLLLWLALRSWKSHDTDSYVTLGAGVAFAIISFGTQGYVCYSCCGKRRTAPAYNFVDDEMRSEAM